jgi:hypothetical protein
MKRFKDFIEENKELEGLHLVKPGHWKHKNGSIHWENDRVRKKGVGTYRVMRGDNLSSKETKKYRSLAAAKAALD